jgi:hypothetical protein
MQHLLSFIAGLLMLASIARGAYAEEAPSGPQRPCVDIAVPKAAITAHGGTWTDLTAEQWEFLRGVYVLNPNTPEGLPFGSRAVLAQIKGHDGAIVYFIDGEKACAPMFIPQLIVEMLRAIAAGRITHEGLDN